MIINLKVCGFICIMVYLVGCVYNVIEQIDIIKVSGQSVNSFKCVLVIGVFIGYGLVLCIIVVFGYGVVMFGVFFEKFLSDIKIGMVGWYNFVVFDQVVKQVGLYSKLINGDVFFNEMCVCVIEIIKVEMGGQIDLVVYLFVFLVCKLFDIGEFKCLVFKIIGEFFIVILIDINCDIVVNVIVELVNEQEIEDIVVVMGGEDWVLWIQVFIDVGVLVDNVIIVVYSYVGILIIWLIYWYGMLGCVKQYLDNIVVFLCDCYVLYGFKVYVGVMKLVVIQVSVVILVILLYVLMVFKIMKVKGIYEGIIEQINCLFCDFFYCVDGVVLQFDDEYCLCLDDWELCEDVQFECKVLWLIVNIENFNQFIDYVGYCYDFLKLFGFDCSDVDYMQDVVLDVWFDCVEM